MPLTSISDAKELSITYQPVLLAELTFPDASVLRLADENFVASDGGPQFQGHDWLPRIKSQNLAAIQAVSDNGIVQSPTIELVLADADKELLTQWENPKGFKGAKLRVLFALWDADTANFSSDYAVKFIGVCNAPSWDESTLTVSAINKLNLSRTMLPTTRIGRTCPWIFPTNHDQRLDAANNYDSPFYLCGYSPEVPGDGGAGNMGAPSQSVGGIAVTDAAGFFVFCGKTKDDCLDRMGNRSLPTSIDARSGDTTHNVQIERDHLMRITGRFGGIAFDPPLDWRGISYTSGTKGVGLNDPNLAKFNGDYFPMVWGTTFVDPPVMNVIGDPNSTRMEVVVCVGEIHDTFATPGPIQTVVVNDYVVPFRGQGLSNDPKILGWEWVCAGSRRGGCNRDFGYNASGDPYGNLACIMIVVPIQVASSNAVPTVRILTSGPRLRKWNSADPSDNTWVFPTPLSFPDPGSNSSWVLADILTRLPFTADDLDLSTFKTEADYADHPVSYTDLTGTIRTHPRYHAGFSLRQRRPASDVLKNYLAGVKGMLMPNLGLSDDSNAGKLQFVTKKTTAEQGGSKYRFDLSNVLRKGDRTTPISFKVTQRPISDTPNKLSVSFQDEDYYWNNDGLEIDDSGDIGRVGQEVAGGTTVEGVVNWDQCKRALQTQFYEQYRGNPRTGIDDLNDSGGTWIAEWESSFRAIDLRIGDIVTLGADLLFTDDDQTFRLISISPSPNFERITFQAIWHEDDPYTDGYGQSPDPKLEQQLKNKLRRPPFGWNPNFEAPGVFDPMFEHSEKTYGLAQVYEAAADGTAICKLRWTGYLPVDAFATLTSPPFAPQAETSAGAGDVPANDYWMALCGVDANGLLTPPSFPVAHIAVPVNSSSMTLPNIFWPVGNLGYKLYAGTNPNKLSLQIDGSSGGTPDSLTLTAYNVASEAMPDVMFDHLVLRSKICYHAGVWGAQINAIPSAHVFEVDGFGFTTDEWAGRTVSIIGQPDTDKNLPIWDFRIASNTDTQFTLAAVGWHGHGSTVPNLTGLGIKVGDVVIMRTSPDIISPTSIGDSKFVNEVKYFEPPIAIIGATNASPIVLTLRQPYYGVDGDEVNADGVLGNTAANGNWEGITVSDDKLQITLPGSTGNGDYDSGGILREVTDGLQINVEVGRIVRIISGTGRGQKRKIVANDRTSVTIDGTWSILPNITSAFIIEDAAWLQELATDSIYNSDPTKEIVAYTTIDNFLGRTLWTQVFTASKDGLKESVETESPGREIYVFGGPGTASVNYPTANFIIPAGNEVASDVTTYQVVRRPGDLVDCTAIATIPPATTDMTVDIFVNSWDPDTLERTKTSIFGGTKMVIATGILTPQKQTTFRIAPLHLNEGDVLTSDITQTDGTGYVNIVLKWKIA
jgi:hypothetical protein